MFFPEQQKEVVIPTKSHKNGGDGFGDTPSFVRNVMGSSAGAGSGEFHVYRHLRRKEYARQKQLQQQSVKVHFVLNIFIPIELKSFLLFGKFI